MTTTPKRVQLRRTSTPGLVPSGMLPGELQPNLADRRLFVGDANNNTIELLGRQKIDIRDRGGVGDGRKLVLAVSINAGGNTLTVALVPAWAATTAYAFGAVRTNNGRAYNCVVAGTSGATGPIATTQQGAAQIDGTAAWVYLGPAATSASVFAATDVGKMIAVNRQDVSCGWGPWYLNGDGGPTTITGYNSPTSVTVAAAGSTAPTGANAYPNVAAQSWPYSATPSVVVWGTDNGAAMQAGFDAVYAQGGGTLFVPAGNWCVSKFVTMHSDTALEGSRRGTTILPCVPVHQAAYAAVADVIPFLANNIYKTVPFRGGYTSNTAAALRAVYGEKNFSVSNLTIDLSCASRDNSQVSMRYFLAEHIVTEHLTIFGSPLCGMEGPNYTGCADFETSHCNLVNTYAGFEPWGGENSGTCSDNRFVLPPSYDPLGLQEVCAIQVNAVGSNEVAEDEVASTLQVCRNRIFMNGNTTTIPVKGLMLFPLNGSVIQHVNADKNQITCTGVNNSPIVLSGPNQDISLDGNIIIGADGTNHPPVGVQENTVNTGAPALITGVTTTNGSGSFTVNWPGHGFLGTEASVIPFYFFAVTGPTIGGILVQGYFRVTAVPDANHLTCLSAQLATSSTTGAWNGSYANINAPPVNVSVTNTRLVDCAAPGAALIDVSGTDIQVHNNDAFLTSGATTGNYLALVRFRNYYGTRPGSARFNTGPTGSGATGGSGNNRVTWTGSVTPTVLDLDEATGTFSVLNTSMSVTGAVTANGGKPVRTTGDAGVAAVVVAVGASPFSYSPPTSGAVVVAGATTTTVAINRGPSTVGAGATQGAFPVRAGDTVVVFYSGAAPTMTFLGE